MDQMADLVEAGIIRAIGVSNFSADKMVAAHEALAERSIPLASNQVQVSLHNRRILSNGVLDAAKDLGTTIIAYSPLGQGLLTGKFHDNSELLKNTPRVRRRLLRRKLKKSQPLIDELKAIAETHSVTPAQIALNWVINFQDDIVVAIPGASKPIHAKQNAEAMEFKLSSEERKTIDDLSIQFIES